MNENKALEATYASQPHQIPKLADTACKFSVWECLDTPISCINIAHWSLFLESSFAMGISGLHIYCWTGKTQGPPLHPHSLHRCTPWRLWSITFCLARPIYSNSDSVVNTPPLSPPRVGPDAYVEKLKRHWAKGSRLELLICHVSGYCAASLEGHSHAQEYLDSVVNEYFIKFPWRLMVSEDPVPPVSDAPTTEKLSTAEIEQKRQKIVAMRKVSLGIWASFISIMPVFYLGN